MDFRTKYTVPTYSGVEMNPYDAVDRLSYVDTTQQIVSFFKAGVNMRLQRAQMMVSDLKDGADFNAPSMTVYSPDIAESYAQLHALQDQLKENQRLLSERREAEMKAKVSTSPEKGADSDLPSAT